MAIPQWTVKSPHGAATPAVFETELSAWRYAAESCQAVAPCIITTPDGGVFYVFRSDRLVELSTRHVVGTTRRVVEP